MKAGRVDKALKLSQKLSYRKSFPPTAKDETFSMSWWSFSICQPPLDEFACKCGLRSGLAMALVNSAAVNYGKKKKRQCARMQCNVITAASAPHGFARALHKFSVMRIFRAAVNFRNSIFSRKKWLVNVWCVAAYLLSGEVEKAEINWIPFRSRNEVFTFFAGVTFCNRRNVS